MGHTSLQLPPGSTCHHQEHPCSGSPGPHQAHPDPAFSSPTQPVHPPLPALPTPGRGRNPEVPSPRPAARPFEVLRVPACVTFQTHALRPPRALPLCDPEPSYSRAGCTCAAPAGPPGWTGSPRAAPAAAAPPFHSEGTGSRSLVAGPGGRGDTGGEGRSEDEQVARERAGGVLGLCTPSQKPSSEANGTGRRCRGMFWGGGTPRLSWPLITPEAGPRRGDTLSLQGSGPTGNGGHCTALPLKPPLPPREVPWPSDRRLGSLRHPTCPWASLALPPCGGRGWPGTTGSPGAKSPSSSESSGQDSGVEPLLSVTWLWPEGWSLALRSRWSGPGPWRERQQLRLGAHPHLHTLALQLGPWGPAGVLLALGTWWWVYGRTREVATEEEAGGSGCTEVSLCSGWGITPRGPPCPQGNTEL